MVLAGALPWLRGVLLFPAQLLGGLVAAGLVSAMFPGTMPVTTTLGANTSIARGLFIEMFCTFLLVFTILMLAAEKQKSTFIAPIGIGLSLFVAELSGKFRTCQNLGDACLKSILTIGGSRVLYWWLPQSHPLLRPCSGEPLLSWIPLDLLAWTAHGWCAGSRLLSSSESS